MTCSLVPFSFSAGVVPSGSPSDMGWCQAFQLISNVIGLMSYIAFAIATLGVIWGGITLLTSMGSESRVKSGKGIIKAALIGYAIVLGANIIVVAIFAAFGLDRSLLPW